MALFSSDIEAFIYLVLIIVGLLILNRIIKAITSSKKVSAKTRIIIKFFFNLISLAIIIYIILNFPAITGIDETYIAIITSSVSTAIAFASSGIFDNVVSGLVLLAIKPYDLNDVVKLKGLIGVVRDLKLTKTVIETFDNIKVEFSNKDIINAELTNYSIKMDKIKSFIDFKREIHYSEDTEFPPIESEDLKQEEESMLRNIFNRTIHRQDNPKIHNYIWRMEFPYERFRLALKKIEQICKNYEKRFDFKPTYHIDGFGHFIEVRFRILTTKSEKIFNIQPEFANDIYKVVHEMWERI